MSELVEEWKKSKIRRQKGAKRTGSWTARLAQEAGFPKRLQSVMKERRATTRSLQNAPVGAPERHD
jgi:hypothetical protein